MSVALDANTVTTALWPTSGKPTKSTGQIFDAVLAGRGGVHFTHVAFTPQDETTFYASSSEGSVFVFSLRGNSVKLFATLDYSVSAMACCGSSTNPSFLCATEDSTLIWIDCNTSRILKREKTPHQHIVHMISAPSGVGCSLWVATISRDLLAIWDVAQMVCLVHSQITMRSTLHNFMSVHAGMNFLITVEWSGCIRVWNPVSLMPLGAVEVEITPCAAAACPKFIAIAGVDGTVGLLKTDDLSSIGRIQISKDSVATRSISIINDDLIACELASGTVVFVVASSYSVAFAMNAPCSGVVSRRSSMCVVSGPSFAAFVCDKQLTLFHLPTARQFYLRGAKWNSVDPNPSLTSQVYPFLQKGDTVIEPPLTVKEEKREMGDTTLPRRTFKPTPQQVSKWVKVGMLPSATGASKHIDNICGASLGTVPVSAKRRKKKEGSVGNYLSVEKEFSLRSFLNNASKEANMRGLKRLLMRYGVFPEKYRPFTWRFLLQLPEQRFTAPQYAQLLEKGPHQFVPFLMKPFPLADHLLRGSMETVLSILIWFQPFFACIHFLPMIVYPFLQVFEDDLQSVVEVVLVFLSNWGQEFFQYYPHHPVALTTLLNQVLLHEDSELHAHLKQYGIMVVEWGWGAMCSLYTDILPSLVWLQVMDHAFFNKTLWLFLFHIQWLVHIREELMVLKDQTELLAALTSPHSIDVNRIIAETYSLFERFPEEELTIPYSTDLYTFVNYAYPTSWRFNEEALNRKLMDMKQSIEQEMQTGDSKRRIHGIYEQISQAENLDEVLIEKKRVQVAAQLTSASDSWLREVAREKENQRVRDMENAARLQRMQQQIEQAERLDSIHEEISATRGQVANLAQVSEKESLHWRRAERLTDHELQRLEDAARQRLARAVRAIEADEKAVLAIPQGIEKPVTDAGITTTRGTSLLPLETPEINEAKSDPVRSYRRMQNCATRGAVVALRPPEEHSPHVWLSTTPAPPVPMTDSRCSVTSSPLYDNLLTGDIPLGGGTSKGSATINQHSKERCGISDGDGRSSAGTVLLRPQRPEAYRLPRQQQ